MLGSEKKLFIGYIHADTPKLKQFATLLSLHSFDLRMDVKNMSGGDYYTTKILNGIHGSDLSNRKYDFEYYETVAFSASGK